MKYVYGKHESRKAFALMDINAGMTVRNKARATRLTDEEVVKFMANEAPRNPDWQFEVRDAH